MNLIFKLFKPAFTNSKTWESGVQTSVQMFDYETIIEELSKYKLQFGVRQYDPKLMTDKRIVPTKWLSTALFTEGNFKKETRKQIMDYWKNWSPNPGKKSKEAKSE